MKTMKNVTEEDTRQWKDFIRSWNSRINSTKMATLPKASHRSSVIPIKILMVFFIEIENKS